MDTIDQAKKIGEIASGVSTRNMTLSIMAIHDGNIFAVVQQWLRSRDWSPFSINLKTKTVGPV